MYVESLLIIVEAIIVDSNGANLNVIWNSLIQKAVEGHYIDRKLLINLKILSQQLTKDLSAIRKENIT